MSNSYKLVVFDWEGTIADTLGLVLNTVATEARALGFGEVDPYLARKYVDLGLLQALKKLFPHLSIREQDTLVQAVQGAMLNKSAEVCIFPGARELIEKLHQKHIDLAIATNKGQHSLQRALHATGLEAFFKVTRSAGQAAPKPCPQMLEEIMTECGADASSTLMIGDSVSDIEMAVSIQVAALGVDFYLHQESALKKAGAIAVFNDYKVLANFLGFPEA